MLTEELKRPTWLESRESTRAWQGKAKRLGAFLLSACDPRLSSGDAGGGIAWLDGLRGFAAFLVYCAHHNQFTAHGDHNALWHSYGYNGEYNFGSLPFVRFFFAGGGRIAVGLFFVISGFVLSYSPMRLVQTRPEDANRQLATRIGTSFARRWIRLFLPVIVVTFAFMASWHLFHVQSGAYEATAPTATFLEETIRWWKEFVDGSYVFHTINAFAGNHYNPHMWSIAVEYRGSILIYVLVLAYFSLAYSPKARFWSSLGLFLYFQYAVAGQYYACFVMGLLICDLTIVSELKPSLLPLGFGSQFFKLTWIYYLVLVAGVYLASVPHPRTVAELRDEPGWFFLSQTVPPACADVTWYFAAFGAALIVTAIPHIRWMKRTFESRPLQYLGKVSFGFYLVHGPILWTVGDRIYAAVGRPTGRANERIPEWVNSFPISDSGPVGLEINAVLPHLILLPLSLWMAAFVTKVVDMPTVKLSKYLFGPPKKSNAERSGTSWEMEGMLPQNEETLPR